MSHHAAFLSFAGVHFILLSASLIPILFAPAPKRLTAVIWIEKAIVTQPRFWCLAASVAFAAL